MGYTEEQKKELYFANTVIGAIKNVKVPMLMYEEEKNVVEKALRMYIDKIESDSRRQNKNIGGKEVCHDRKVRFTPKQY